MELQESLEKIRMNCVDDMSSNVHLPFTGTVRYVGPIDFADGVWIGVELRSPKGRHDGVVQGKRYFNAKPEHGVLVRPSRVSVRGISGTKLLRETFSPD